VTAYSRSDAEAENKARQRVNELRQAGWSSAGYRFWKGLQDGNEFFMVHVKTFGSEAEQERFRIQHQSDLRRFESVRSFNWLQGAVPEPDDSYNGRVWFNIMTYVVGIAVGVVACYGLIGWPLGVASGHGASEPEPTGCLASCLPGYAAGYRSGAIGSAKRTASEEARRGDQCVARQSLSDQSGGYQ